MGSEETPGSSLSVTTTVNLLESCPLSPHQFKNDLG
jgi:hypothetical protein